MHKTATTWLQEYLFPLFHDQIPYNEPKNYKILTDIFRYGCSENDILRAKEHFKNIHENQFFSAEIMCGDLFQGYPEFKQHIDIIENVFEEWDINVVFVLRRPSEWLFSCYKESMFEHHYSSYEEFLACHPWITETGLYHSIPSMIDELESRNKLAVLFLHYDKFCDDINSFNSDLCRFIGLRQPAVPTKRPNNVGYSVNTIIFLNKVVLTLKKLGLNFLIPEKIQFFGPNSIYLKERKRFSTPFEQAVLRKILWPVRRGNWLRLIFRTLDKHIFSQSPQKSLRHGFHYEKQKLDTELMTRIKRGGI